MLLLHVSTLKGSSAGSTNTNYIFVLSADALNMRKVNILFLKKATGAKYTSKWILFYVFETVSMFTSIANAYR
jgi:hypothetical protein